MARLQQQSVRLVLHYDKNSCRDNTLGEMTDYTRFYSVSTTIGRRRNNQEVTICDSFFFIPRLHEYTKDFASSYLPQKGR